MPDEPLSLVIDTDTASDDAVALVLALLEPEAAVHAITVVAGNVPLARGLRNCLGTLAVLGRGEVPVHLGLDRPLLRTLVNADEVHGHDGLGGVALPPALAPERPEHAVDVLRRAAADDPGRHTLVTLGPLSNVATAVLIEPDLLARYRCTYLMVGAPDLVGNIGTFGEYNAWVDPEALAIVLAAPGDKVIVGWNVSRQAAVVTHPEQEALRGAGPIGRFIVDVNRQVDHYAQEVSGLAGFDLPDPVTMAVALDPGIVTSSERVHVSVGLDDHVRGATLLDRRAHPEAPNATVVWEVDEAAFKARLARAAAWVPAS